MNLEINPRDLRESPVHTPLDPTPHVTVLPLPSPADSLIKPRSLSRGLDVKMALLCRRKSEFSSRERFHDMTITPRQCARAIFPAGF